MLRLVVQRNPGMLPNLLAELGRNNPQLVAVINANQAEFLQLLNEPLPDGLAEMADLADMGEEGDDGDEPMPGAVAVDLSQEV